MTYCRKCGTKLAEDARFCYNCGAPVVVPVEQAPSVHKEVPFRKNPLFIPVIVIIAIALSALVIAVVVSAPLYPVNFNEQNQIEQTGSTKLNLDFYADIGDIYVYTNLTGDNRVLMDVSATGRTSIFGSDQPVTFTVQNTPTNNTQMVNADVSSTVFPFSGNLDVVCKIYVNPEADLMLTVHSSVGEVYMDADSNAELSMLNLKTTTGNTRLNLQEGATVKGSLTVSTVTGSVWLSMNEVDIKENCTFSLQATTGNVNMNITQTRNFDGNLHINGRAVTGNVNLDKIVIDDKVAAKIQSDTGLGQIKVNIENFNGNQETIQSNNYPSECNIDFNLNTSVGNINIDATYKTDIKPSLRV